MLLRGSADYHPSVKEVQMLEMTGSKGTDELLSPRVFNTHLQFPHLPTDMIKRQVLLVVSSAFLRDSHHNSQLCVCHSRFDEAFFTLIIHYIAQ